MGLNVTSLGGYVCEGHCDVNRSVYTYSTAPVNNWKHWVVTVNGSTIKMYLDGVLVQTDNVYSGATYKQVAVLGGLIYITGLDPYGYYYKGKLDDVRIYDDAITDAQVLQLYKNESTGMAAYYPFNGNANDESGNGNNGTVNGATLTTDRFGIANKAYNFTNPNHISIPNSNIFGDEFTLSYWFKINSYFGQRGVMSNVEVPN
ncbi:MAG: LamG domain-containing protein [Chitinophagaceae bacterium]|nr:LamG domain-containing protein [Chitinophagaceae bacterium]